MCVGPSPLVAIHVSHNCGIRKDFEATQSSMDKVLEEAAQVNAVAKENVVSFLNSMTLDPLSFSLNSSNP